MNKKNRRCYLRHMCNGWTVKYLNIMMGAFRLYFAAGHSLCAASG